MAQQVRILGEGGSVIVMDLPLQADVQERLDKGHLRLVGDDGVSAVPARDRPARVAPKKDWVGWAVFKSQDDGDPITADEAEGMTKQDLIELYGG